MVLDQRLGAGQVRSRCSQGDCSFSVRMNRSTHPSACGCRAKDGLDSMPRVLSA
jgi:hypothetical protein